MLYDPTLLPLPRSLASEPLSENVLPLLQRFLHRRQRCALVTLVGIDGGSPRYLGAQMAVCEDGAYAGYLSGGCLEKAIVLEAVNAIEKGAPKLLRYGQGSPFFDIQLPCGSGLDILIQPIKQREVIDCAVELLEDRQPFILTLGLKDGSLSLQTKGPFLVSRCTARDVFERVYHPVLRSIIIGSAPIAFSLADLAQRSSFAVEFYTAAAQGQGVPLSPAIRTRSLHLAQTCKLDARSAVILAFHDHDQEIQILKALLPRDFFFITAIGSRRAHEARRAALIEEGISEALIAKIESPAGTIPGLKSAPHVALCVLARLLEVAGSKQLLAQ